MNNQSSSQLELFSQARGYNGYRRGIGNSFLRRIRIYEKAILISMGFIITAIVAFSLGVEKGKSLAILKSDMRFDTANRKQPQVQFSRTKNIMSEKQPLAEREPQTVIPRQDAPILQKPRENLQNYTIQLASYTSRAYAQKEADALKKRGLEPLIVSKGQYAVLYVGSFSDKKNARALLSDLEKQYRDCFIRRI